MFYKLNMFIILPLNEQKIPSQNELIGDNYSNY